MGCPKLYNNFTGLKISYVSNCVRLKKSKKNLRRDYLYGFNGQMKENEIAGVGNHNTALFWEYDTRLGRRWNLDPKPHIGISDYSTFGDNPIANTDVNGDYFFGLIGSTKAQRTEARRYADATGGHVTKIASSEVNVGYDKVSNSSDTRGVIVKARQSVFFKEDGSSYRKGDSRSTQVLNSVSINNTIPMHERSQEEQDAHRASNTDKYGNYPALATGSITPLYPEQMALIPPIGKLLFAGVSTTGRVFYTGGTSLAAEDYAAMHVGMTTINTTTTGKILTSITNATSYTLTKPLWKYASKQFANGAEGEASVIFGMNKFSSKSIFATTERPILEGNGVFLKYIIR